jgi:hypothetical protein
LQQVLAEKEIVRAGRWGDVAAGLCVPDPTPEEALMSRSLWQRLLRRWLCSAGASPARRPLRPAAEVLEARWLPSNVSITVNDNRDVLDNPATVTVGTLGNNVTLRDAPPSPWP